MAYNLLKGKRGIITGALDENSIAWKVAEKAHEEGATFVLTNAPIAMRMGEINKLAEKTNSKIIPADATSVEELTTLFTQSQEVLGGKIDRVDRKGKVVRVVDYKTGRVDFDFDSIESLFNRDGKRNKAAFQTLLYAWLYVKSNSSKGDELVPGLYNSKNLFNSSQP